MSTHIEQSIYKTVAWFSMFETPVTVFELWKWMLTPDRPYSLEETHAALNGEWLRERLVEREGMWTTRDSTEPLPPTPGVGGNAARRFDHQPRALVVGRRARFVDATRKYKKLRRAMRFVRLVPGVVGVAAGNTLAWWNTRPDSDIDLLVVTRPGMIWLARLLVVTPFALLGKRPGAASVDPFCFSFFVTTDALRFSSLRLEGGDPYLAYWAKSLVPVFDRGGVFDRMVVENGWTRDVLPNAEGSRRMTTPHAVGRDPANGGGNPSLNEGGETRKKVTGVATIFERLAKAIQHRRFPPKIRALMNVDSRVVVSDRMLKFHENDRRAEYRDRLNALCPSPASQTPSSS